jgi:hypothetical protein
MSQELSGLGADVALRLAGSTGAAATPAPASALVSRKRRNRREETMGRSIVGEEKGKDEAGTVARDFRGPGASRPVKHGFFLELNPKKESFPIENPK